MSSFGGLAVDVDNGSGGIIVGVGVGVGVGVLAKFQIGKYLFAYASTHLRNYAPTHLRTYAPSLSLWSQGSSMTNGRYARRDILEPASSQISNKSEKFILFAYLH